MDYVGFEKPIAELEKKIDELQLIASTQAINLDKEIEKLHSEALKLRTHIFSNLTAYETVQMARHPRRPNTLDYIGQICSTFIELHGDRNFLEDKAMVAGLARIDDQSVAIIGHQKGRGTKENIERNFGMPRPEGYRKALRIMSLAERFKLPIITFIDTPGAYPGVDAEERGQAEAIGKNILIMSRLQVPIICFVIGEGGSGGALAIGVANRIHMLEYSIYSVITPEGCASILLKDSTKASKMAEELKLTADSALSLGVIDSIIKEPLGGAHLKVGQTASAIKRQIITDLAELKALEGSAVRQQRIEKYFSIGKTHQTERS